MNVHVSRQRELESQGWVRLLIQKQGDRIEMANPKTTCLKPVSREQCLLDKNHRGKCTANVFYCDGCGKMRSGNPTAMDENVALCFFCVKKGERRGPVHSRRDA